MLRRSVRPLEDVALEALTTARLMDYRSRLLGLEVSATASDLDDAERTLLDPSVIHFKDDPRWSELYFVVKSILAKREHLD